MCIPHGRYMFGQVVCVTIFCGVCFLLSRCKAELIDLAALEIWREFQQLCKKKKKENRETDIKLSWT